jgi:hypothetical protein
VERTAGDGRDKKILFEAHEEKEAEYQQFANHVTQYEPCSAKKHHYPPRTFFRFFACLQTPAPLMLIASQTARHAQSPSIYCSVVMASA